MVEDLAHTRGMLMSPRTWRRLFKPFTYRLGRFLHDNGIAFWMHCCGNAEPIFKDLIECGLQVIQPLEAKSGLDVRVLREKYGDRLTFWGNIDVITMSDGTDDEIEQEIRSKLTVHLIEHVDEAFGLALVAKERKAAPKDRGRSGRRPARGA